MLKKWFVVTELILLVLIGIVYVGSRLYQKPRKASASVVANTADDRCESVGRPLSLRNFAGKQAVEFYYCVAPQQERADDDRLDDLVYVKLDMVLVVERNGDARAIHTGDSDFKQWKNLFFAELKKLGRKPQYLNRQAAFTAPGFLFKT